MSGEPTDLKLGAKQARKGIESAIVYSGSVRPKIAGVSLKDLTVNDVTDQAELSALARLLIAKGVITKEEFGEAVRLELNGTLADLEASFEGMKFR